MFTWHQEFASYIFFVKNSTACESELTDVKTHSNLLHDADAPNVHSRFGSSFVALHVVLII